MTEQTANQRYDLMICLKEDAIRKAQEKSSEETRKAEVLSLEMSQLKQKRNNWNWVIEITGDTQLRNANTTPYESLGDPVIEKLRELRKRWHEDLTQAEKTELSSYVFNAIDKIGRRKMTEKEYMYFLDNPSENIFQDIINYRNFEGESR